MKQGKTKQIVFLSLAALVVIVGGVLLVGAASGWFDSIIEKVTLSEEYLHDEESSSQMITIDTAKFNEMMSGGKTFVAISHLPTCTANILAYLKDYAAEHHFDYFYYPWSELKETALHDKIRFAPSVYIVSNGKLITYLSADSDADTAKYNDYNEFAAWLDSYKY